MQNTLLNVSGVVIAFIALMLLFSLIVTGLVQATQSIFRLRARNLLWGVARILEKAATEKKANVNYFIQAAHLLAKTSTALPTSFKIEFPRLLGPSVSWLEPDDLERTIEAINNANKENPSEKYDAHQARSDFQSISDPLTKRFQVWTRWLSILFAGLVAWYFQLSTPDLLAELSTNPEMVQQLQYVVEPSLDIRPGRIDHFFSSWEHRLGWLITVILLSLGAPFWFNRLKEALSLRDQLRSGKAQES